MTDDTVEEHISPASVIEWSSHKVQRVVRSTLAAEAGALNEAHDRNEYTRVIEAVLFGKVRVDKRGKGGDPSRRTS